ncbi:conserved hypothetical protein [Trichinella spiralis]|uniref:hypothetical protein n=1 Tax=Trichinella spiralis TaxID=6334 RepID=UPI0001EFC0FC|nr:conserved hypothetical protein [Trichinella spiralis]
MLFSQLYTGVVHVEFINTTFYLYDIQFYVTYINRDNVTFDDEKFKNPFIENVA